MSFQKRANITPIAKPNFINNKTNVAVHNKQVDPGSLVIGGGLGKSKMQIFGYTMTDKFLRPVMAGVVGLIFISVYIQNPVFNMYGLNKFFEFAISSMIADYIGNTFFSSLSLLKSQGIMTMEDIVIESLLAGLIYATLDKYWMGKSGTFLMDAVVGGGTNLVAGLATNLIRMSF